MIRKSFAYSRKKKIEVETASLTRMCALLDEKDSSIAELETWGPSPGNPEDCSGDGN